MNRTQQKKPSIGLALGAGAARGWGHIGVIRALEARGIRPDIICGASAGALVGAAYASGHLDGLEKWLRKLKRIDILRLMDAGLTGGGFIQGHKLMKVLGEPIADMRIEELDLPYAAVATELESGRERWLREGPLLEAVRASVAVPGLFTPVLHDGIWLVDGGLVNPVPVSVCRALGAEIVIAVNVNGGLLTHFSDSLQRESENAAQESWFARLAARLQTRFKFKLPALMASSSQKAHEAPGIFDVIAASINIVQDRITRSRMAGEPPDILITPRLAHIRLMEFDRASEAIEEGLASVERNAEQLDYLLETGQAAGTRNV